MNWLTLENSGLIHMPRKVAGPAKFPNKIERTGHRLIEQTAAGVAIYQALTPGGAISQRHRYSERNQKVGGQKSSRE